MKTLFTHTKKPVCPKKPKGVHVPERVWRRQSALYMSLTNPSLESLTLRGEEPCNR